MESSFQEAIDPREDEEKSLLSNDINNQNRDNDKVMLEQCIEVLTAHSIRVVVFDMDLTAVAMHSRGCLPRCDLPLYLQKTTRDFQTLVPWLHQRGFFLAVATHSDEAEFETARQSADPDNDGSLLPNNPIHPDTHILGHELATRVVEHSFSADIAARFFIVAYNPRARGQTESPLNCLKRYHMREIQQRFGVTAPEILLFDDTPEIIMDCRHHCGVNAVLVNPEQGFRLSDLLSAWDCSSAETKQQC